MEGVVDEDVVTMVEVVELLGALDVELDAEVVDLDVDDEAVVDVELLVEGVVEAVVDVVVVEVVGAEEVVVVDLDEDDDVVVEVAEELVEDTELELAVEVVVALLNARTYVVMSLAACSPG